MLHLKDPRIPRLPMKNLSLEMIQLKMNRNLSRHIKGLALAFIVILSYSCEVNYGDEVAVIDNPDLDAQLQSSFDIMNENPVEALKLCDDAFAQALDMDSYMYMGKAKWYKGYIYDVAIKDLSNAYFNYNDALSYYLQTDDSESKAALIQNISIMLRSHGQYDKSVENYLLALEYKDEITSKLLANIYYDLGYTYSLIDDPVSFDKAEEFISLALELSEEIDYKSKIALANNQIGLMYKNLGDYDLSRIAYMNTISKYSSNPDLSEEVGKAYHGIGVTYMDAGDDENAILNFRKALEFKDVSSSIFVTKYDLGTVLYRSGQTDKAVNIWKDAVNEDFNKYDLQHVKIYSDLGNALEESAQFGESASYSKVFNASIDKIIADIENYKSQTDQIMFADIVRQYDEFKQTTPWYEKPWVLGLALVILGLMVYGGTAVYFRSRSSRKVSEVMTKLQSEFQHLRVE